MNTSGRCQTAKAIHSGFQVKMGHGVLLSLYAQAVFTKALAALSLCVAILALFSNPAVAAYRPVLPIDNTCVISILNRTVTPDPTGKFQLDHVPSLTGIQYSVQHRLVAGLIE